MSRLVLLVSLLLATSLSQALTISRTLYKPDGKPAAGAGVLIRTLKADGTLKEDRRVTADAKGAITADVEVETMPAPMKRAGYLLITTPGCAVTLAELTLPEQSGGTGAAFGRPADPPGTIRLLPAYGLTGSVRTAAGTPVPGAKLTVHALGANDPWGFQKCWVNAGAGRLVTPELTTVSGADGAFTLKGVVIARPAGSRGRDGGEPIPITVSAQATGPDGTLLGEARLTFNPSPLRPGDAVNENRITLLPALTARGKVLHAVTGLPVAGATVQLVAPLDVIGTRPAVVTQEDGAYEFLDMAADSRLFATATHPQLASAWLRLTEPAPDGAPRPHPTKQTTLSLRPLVKVTGKLVDPITRQAPVAPLTILATYDEGYADGLVAVGRAGVAVKTDADGSFLLTTAIGGNTLFVTGPGYRGAARLLSVGVPAGGLEGVSIPLERERGVLCRFETPELAGLTAQVRLPGEEKALGRVPAIKADGWWFYPMPADWAVIEMRVLRHGMGVTPWSILPLDPGQWPIAVKVP
jgi:hypothetical protein